MSATFKKVFSKSLLDKDLLYSFPKIELHRHLEGTFDIDTLYRLSVKNNLDTPRDIVKFKEYCQFPKHHKPDFLLFLDKFHNNWYGSLDDVYEVVFNSVSNLKKEGLFYIELRFSPEHFSLVQNFDRIEVTRIVIQAAEDAARETELKMKYLLTFNRSKQLPSDMLTLYKKIIDQDFPHIVGVDLAGDETNYPPEQFVEFFDEVHKIGLHKIDIHAGEVSGSHQIWTAIDQLHASRIGHGVSSVNDIPLQKALKERKINLCQCITSNYQTAAWPDSSTHPIGNLFREGVPVSINSDDPTIQNADLIEDYYKIIDYFNFSFEEMVQINLNTIDASFLSSEEQNTMKEDYINQIKSFIKENS